LLTYGSGKGTGAIMRLYTKKANNVFVVAKIASMDCLGGRYRFARPNRVSFFDLNH
jgi:hypothetical protein